MKIVRAPRVRIFDHHDATTVVARDGVVRRFEAEHAALLREVLRRVAVPCTRAELLDHLAALAGGPIDDPSAVDDLLALLTEAGVLRRVEATLPPSSAHRPRSKIVVGLTGAVATMHAPQLVRTLLARRHRVRVALTSAARRFVAVDALAALTHEAVYTGLFDGPGVAPHIQLAEWADGMLLWPASATTIARIAAGDCSDLVAAVAIATRAPVVVAPSMNPGMLLAPSVQRNLETLSDDGFFVVHPDHGEEVAHAPTDRLPVLGGAPEAATIADLLDLIVPAPAETDWDDVFRTVPDEALPWFEAAPDADLMAVLDPERARHVLDVGTGLGSTAIAAAKAGCTVVATDVSAVAIERARRRAGDLAITWLVDDITRSNLDTPFDAIVDRGCLQVLSGPGVDAYVETIARLTKPGASLLLKVLAQPSLPGITAYSTEQIRALFEGRFDLVEARPTTFGGTVTPDPAATLFVLSRIASPGGAP